MNHTMTWNLKWIAKGDPPFWGSSKHAVFHTNKAPSPQNGVVSV